jgi:hypothetical protein
MHTTTTITAMDTTDTASIATADVTITIIIIIITVIIVAIVVVAMAVHGSSIRVAITQWQCIGRQCHHCRGWVRVLRSQVACWKPATPATARCCGPRRHLLRIVIIVILLLRIMRRCHR